MGSNYQSVPRNRGAFMSPIPSEKRKSRPAPVYSFTWLDIGVVLVSMGTYLADIVTDILVTLVYWKLDEKIWAGLTLTFLIVPSIIMQVFSTRWYVADGHRATFSMFLIHILLMGPIKRYITVLKFGLRARKTKRIEDYQSMYSELSDVSMLRLFESFLESAPQLVLQLYIMIKVTEEDHILTGIAAFFSLISLAWAIAAYTKALRTAAFSQDSRKNRVSWSGLALQTLWRVGMVAGRIVALVLFATAYPIWLLAGVGVHWFIMTIWLVAQDTDFCGSWWEERLFNAVIGEIHIFCFFNMKEGRSRWRMIAFYLLTLVENSAMILLWFPNRTVGMWYNIPALITVWGGFIIGLLSMLLYYRYFHPSSKRKCHCCMLYYHLVYRLCPCNNATAFHGTPYKSAHQDFADSENDSSFENYDPVSATRDHEQIPRFTENRKTAKKETLDGGNEWDSDSEYGENLQGKKYEKAKKFEKGRKWAHKTQRLGLEVSEEYENDKNTLLMPKPRATSTPGDEIEEKFVKKYQNLHKLTQNKGVIFEDRPVSFTSLSSSTESFDNSKYLTCPNKSPDNVAFTDMVTTTPTALKNLPGANNTPGTNKGNSTLVREWVKKAQDMYGPKSSDDKNGDGSEAAGGAYNDFGTLGTRHATKDERDFMEAHFGDPASGPSGRRDILRLKSFNKKDRQPPKKRAKKRRKSDYTVSDLRNTFREAFGFHAVEQDQVSESDEEIAKQTKIIKKQPNRKIKTKTWAETEIDPVTVETKQKQAANLKPVNNSHKIDFVPQRVNVILARVDKPPTMEDLLSYKCNSKTNTATLNKDKLEMENFDENKLANDGMVNSEIGCPVPIDQLKIDMENLHGTPITVPLSSANFDSQYDNHGLGVSDSNRQIQNNRDEPCVVYHNVHQYIDDGSPSYGGKNLESTNNFTTCIDEVVGVTRLTRDSLHLLENGEERSEMNAHVPPLEDGKIRKVDGQTKIKWRKPSNDLDSSNGSQDNKRNGKDGKNSGGNTIEKSVYDNLTASILVGPDMASNFEGLSNLETKDESAKTQNSCVNSDSDDVFGPVICIQGGKVMIKHRDIDDNDLSEKHKLNLNPAICDQVDQNEKLISSSGFDAEKMKNENKPDVELNSGCNAPAIKKTSDILKPACNGTMRRDRVEYLYKIGRSGLKKAVQDSPARKRLLFKKDDKWCDESDLESNFHEENEVIKQNCNKNDKTSPRNKNSTKNEQRGENSTHKAKKSGNKEMEHSIEALGKSMEGVVDGGENYIIHIHGDGKKKRSRKSLKSLGKERSIKEKSFPKQRRTLGSIENH
ncbi:uncharacterized protein LOC120345331 isoform X1 [Styela clava]